MKNRVIFILTAIVLAALAALCVFIIGGDSRQTSAQSDFGRDIPVIMYHNISEKERLWGTYCVSPETVENDIKYMLEKGYTAVSCQDVINYCTGTGDLPEKPFIITVDDGFESFYAYMYPLLQKYCCKAVIAPIGSCTDAYTSQEDHNLDYSCLTWEELKEMNDSSLVEIGSHTYDLHENRDGRKGCARKQGESDEDYTAVLTKDTQLMQRKIKQFTAADCNIFVYPYGEISKGSEEILAGSGFKVIFTCSGKVNKVTPSQDMPLILGRYNRPHGKTTYNFCKQFITEVN